MTTHAPTSCGSRPGPHLPTHGDEAMKALVHAAALAALLASSATALAGDRIDGRWDARLTHNGIEIPFRLDIKGSGDKIKGTLYDGFRAYEYTTGASYKNGELVLNIDHYLTTITA